MALKVADGVLERAKQEILQAVTFFYNCTDSLRVINVLGFGRMPNVVSLKIKMYCII